MTTPWQEIPPRPAGAHGSSTLRVGLVCPYSWDVPGGVKTHVDDLARALLARGHEVSVLAPSDEDDAVPSYVVPAGRAVPVPYNGSIARLTFGPISVQRVRRWIAEHDFDVLHVHEPAAPSLSIIACWAAEGPMVGTFHTSNPRSLMAGDPALGIDKARSLIGEGARIVVYKMGEKGAITFTTDGEFATGIYRTRALKPTGAGDGFLGAFIAGLAEGAEVRDAVLRGSAAAAMVVARVGCAPATPTRDELDTFLAEHSGPTAA